MKNIFESIRDYLSGGFGCVLAILAIVWPALLIGFFANRCDNSSEKRIDRQTLQAYSDSIKHVEQIERNRFFEEVTEHRSSFYKTFSQKYQVFNNYEDFDEWLNYANYAAIELLHKLYSAKYDDYSGPDGFDRMTSYLFWGPPEYELNCDNCGESMTFSEDEYLQ